MGSIAFDKLWADAVEREGALVASATVLAQVYKIASAMEAVRLARAMEEAGRPFFVCCDAVYKAEQDRCLHRMKRQGRLSERDMKFIKELLAKAAKGWW